MPAIKTIAVDDCMRIHVVDQGDIGISVRVEMRLQPKGRYAQHEEALIPREKVSDVCKAMLLAIGAKNISWEW